MAAITGSLTERIQGTIGRRFNWQYFLQDNITGSWLLTVWVIILTLATLALTVRQMSIFPTETILILVIWSIGILLAVAEGLHIRHSRVGRWLKTNLLSSVSNTLLTLFIMLVLYALAYSIWQWAVVNATFSPALTDPQDRPTDGATWGVIAGAWDLLMVGRFPRDEMGRVTMALVFFILLGGLSLIASKTGLWARSKLVSRILTAFWPLSA
jgi:hypothetical protein